MSAPITVGCKVLLTRSGRDRSIRTSGLAYPGEYLVIRAPFVWRDDDETAFERHVLEAVPLGTDGNIEDHHWGIVPCYNIDVTDVAAVIRPTYEAVELTAPEAVAAMLESRP